MCQIKVIDKPVYINCSVNDLLLLRSWIDFFSSFLLFLYTV